MAENPSNAELESEAPGRAFRIRAAVAAGYQSLLRSIAVFVAKVEWRLRWAEVIELAAELLDEAVQEALKRPEKFDPDRSAAAWVRGIAARLLKNRRRKDAQAQRCVPASVLGDEGWAAALERRCAASGDDAVAGRLDLERALGRLSPEERSTIELRYYQGLDGEALASALGVKTLGAARARVCRALQALRALFPPAEGEVLA